MATTRYPTVWSKLMANCLVVDESGCWEWTGRFLRDCYPRINIWRNGKHCTCRAHRVVAEICARRPLCPDEETVEHACHNRKCINPNHLLLVDRAGNTTSMHDRRLGRESNVQMSELRPLVEDNWQVGVWVHPSEPIPF